MPCVSIAARSDSAAGVATMDCLGRWAKSSSRRVRTHSSNERGSAGVLSRVCSSASTADSLIQGGPLFRGQTMVFGERHLRHVLLLYMNYYNGTRTHLSLNKDAPISRAVETAGRILCRPILGGLHHHYVRI